MFNVRRRWVVSGVLVLGVGAVPRAWGDEPLKLEGPVAGGEARPEPAPEPAPSAEPVETPQAEPGPLHEAFQEPSGRSATVRPPKAPPAPRAETPTDDRPSPDAQWVAGYWSWDPARNDFTWIAGAWRVPPKGTIWVNGRWVRDARGWTRVPGFWSARQAGRVVDRVASPASNDWRVTGPPAAAPADDPGPAPGPDAFYVPGHYTPKGRGVVWTPGYWSRSRPGLEWVPARWVRRPNGWDYREGYWTRESAPATVRAGEPNRHTVARPRLDDDVNPADLPPAIVESEPRDAEPNPDRLPPPPPDPGLGTDKNPAAGRDPIAEAEDADRAAVDPAVPPPVVVVPGPMVRPYVVVPRRGYGPRFYDPLGVVPPFARRIIDRFVP